MKQNITTIWDGSLKSGLSQLQIWILIRNKLIRSLNNGSNILVDISDLKRWMASNRRITYELQLETDVRDSRFNFSYHIKRLINRSKKINNG